MTNPAVELPTLNEYIEPLNAEIKRRLPYSLFAERTASAIFISDAKVVSRREAAPACC